MKNESRWLAEPVMDQNSRVPDLLAHTRPLQPTDRRRKHGAWRVLVR
jgi:hypothetical protein